ncbi:hypothetical protein WR25_20054 isoform A [Diploscapter pachys]|uniref:Histone-lysine N-methyltransferase n=1 Tax=Diploscapter pachys TaxID=2018661 RepID=A0A2A2LUC6_9BILA|nr:hypothetical protein WR25_20054 isoform A [Diploscapter pachys]
MSINSMPSSGSEKSNGSESKNKERDKERGAEKEKGTDKADRSKDGHSSTTPLPKFEIVETSIFSKSISSKKRTEALYCTCADEGKNCKDNRCVNVCMFTECPKDCPAKKCKNRKFTKRKYAKVEPQYTGPEKGFGLFAMESIKKGAFIIEYVGEVLPRNEYEARKEIYAKDPNHKHHYLCDTGAYTIDATKKGNVSRFINHSCAPNACCEKWTVPNTKGNVARIGFFALRDINKGEEITFDYNFQVYGREAQPCHCGAENCMKWIGQVQEEESDDGEDYEMEARANLLDEEEINARLCEIEPIAWTNKKQIRELVTMANYSEYSEQRLRILNTLCNEQAVQNVRSLSLICSGGIIDMFTFWLKEPMIHADDVLLNLRILTLLNGIDHFARLVSPECDLAYSVTQLAQMEEPTDDLVVQAAVQSVVNDVISQEKEAEKAREKHKEAEENGVARMEVGSEGDKEKDENDDNEEEEEETPILTGFTRLVEIAKRVLHTWTSLLVLYKIPKKVKVDPVENGTSRARTPTSFKTKDFCEYDRPYSHNSRFSWNRYSNGRSWNRNNYKRHLSYYDARRYDDYYNMSYSRSPSPSVDRKRHRVETETKDGKEDEQPPPSKRRSRFDVNANGRENGHALPPPSVVTPTSVGMRHHPMPPMPYPGMMMPMPGMPGYDMMYWGYGPWPAFGPSSASLPSCPSSTAFLTAEAPPPPPSRDVRDADKLDDESLKAFKAECAKKTKSELQNVYEVLQKKLDMVREAMAAIRREEAAHKLAAQKEKEAAQEAITAPSSLEDQPATTSLKSASQTMISARSSTPPPAPPPKEKYLWAKAVDANGDKYYYNKETRETQWSPPRPEQGELDPAEKTPPPPCDTSGMDSYAGDFKCEVTQVKADQNLSEESLIARAEQIFAGRIDGVRPRSSQMEERPPSASSEASSKDVQPLKSMSSGHEHRHPSSHKKQPRTQEEQETHFKSYMEKLMRSEIKNLLESRDDTTKEKMEWLGKQYAKELLKKEKAKMGDAFSYDVHKINKSKVLTYCSSLIKRKLEERGDQFWKDYEKFASHHSNHSGH